MHIDVLSLFPSYIEGPLQESMLKRAIERDLIKISSIDIRDFSTRKDGRVDDRPFGGGPGMVLMAEPVVAAIRSRRKPHSRVVYVSPQGELLTPALAKELALLDHLILVSGHYEGIDQRAIESDVDQEISIGDYVLTNGCLAALVIIDVVARFVPGVLGHEDGAAQDSFERGIFDHPQYTVPRVFEGKGVPEVLLSGDHQKIASWRHDRALFKTWERRPDLVSNTYGAALPAQSSCCLQHLIESSYQFEESARFYERLFGVKAVVDAETGRCSFEGIPLTLVRVGQPISFPAPLLSFVVSQEVLERAVSQPMKKLGRVVHKGPGRALFSDPDGRILELRAFCKTRTSF